GGGVAMINRVAEKIPVAMLPELVARLGVETGDHFLQVRAVTDVTHDVKLAAGDDRRGLAGQVRRPQGMLGVHSVREVFFKGSAVLVRPAPAQPAVQGSCASCGNGGELAGRRQTEGADGG